MHDTSVDSDSVGLCNPVRWGVKFGRLKRIRAILKQGRKTCWSVWPRLCITTCISSCTFPSPRGVRFETQLFQVQRTEPKSMATPSLSQLAQEAWVPYTYLRERTDDAFQSWPRPSRDLRECDACTISPSIPEYFLLNSFISGCTEWWSLSHSFTSACIRSK